MKGDYVNDYRVTSTSKGREVRRAGNGAQAVLEWREGLGWHAEVEHPGDGRGRIVTSANGPTKDDALRGAVRQVRRSLERQSPDKIYTMDEIEEFAEDLSY